jgi:hypothetical protein
LKWRIWGVKISGSNLLDASVKVMVYSVVGSGLHPRVFGCEYLSVTAQMRFAQFGPPFCALEHSHGRGLNRPLLPLEQEP